MFRKKLVKRVASCLMAFAMTVSGFPGGTFIGKAATEESDVQYVVAGGSTPVAWGEAAKENVMKKSQYDGVYTISFKMPAYKETEEWLNRFKILRQDEDMGNGWTEQLCLGTDIFGSNQSNIRVENEEEMDITVYYQPESGAVVILDSDENRIDYKFSWVGTESEVKYFTASEFVTCDFSWPKEDIHTDDMPDIKTKNDTLYNYITNGNPIAPVDPVEPVNPEYKNKIHFHFQNGGNWDEVGAWIYQGISWNTNVTDDCVVTVKKSDGTIKKLWPGARCEQEKKNWYTCTATVSDEVISDGLIFKFNNLVADSTTDVVTDQEDLDAILASGLKTTANTEKYGTNALVINRRNPILSDGIIPTDIYVSYDGINATVTNIALDDYINDELIEDKYVDGVLYNYDLTELIKCPENKKGKFNVPDTVKYIRDKAFWNCKELTEINIPKNTTFNPYVDNVASKDNSQFKGCEKLRAVNVAKGNPYYMSIDGVLIDRNGYEIIFYPYSKGNEYIVPIIVKRIRDFIFGAHKDMKLYGLKDSYAEKYAEENEIDFNCLGELISKNNGISDDAVSVLYKDKQLQSDISLNVKDVDPDTIDIENKITNQDVSIDNVKYKAYDIYMEDDNGTKVQPDGRIVVKIKCPDMFNGELSRIYYLNENGKIQDMNAQYSDGYLYFNTNHFSTYLITDMELVTDDTDDVMLGDANSDGQINTQDAVLLKKYLAEYDYVDIDFEASDLNGDGNVTSADAVLLLKHLAEYDVTLGDVYNKEGGEE